MEPEGSFTCSQVPATVTYSGPDAPNLQLYTIYYPFEYYTYI
jgi:hypothetical protein